MQIYFAMFSYIKSCILLGVIYFAVHSVAESEVRAVDFEPRTDVVNVKFFQNSFHKQSNALSMEYRTGKELNQSCRSTSECRNYAYVCGEMHTCNCATGYRPDENDELCVGAIGKYCLYDIHCINGAYCKGQTICTCKLQFPLVSSDRWSCRELGSKASILSSSFLLYRMPFFMLLCQLGFITLFTQFRFSYNTQAGCIVLS